MMIQSNPYPVPPPPPSLVNNGGFVHNGSLPASPGLNVGYPAGLAVNDIAILVATFSDASGPGTTISTPTGWSLVRTQSTVAHRQAIFWKRLDGTETGTVAVGFDSCGASDTATGQISVFRNCIPTGTPFEGADGATGIDSSAESPTTTTLGQSRTIVRVLTNSNSSGTPPAITPPAGWTEQYDNFAPNAAYEVRVEMCTRTQTDAGTLASDTTTVQAATDQGWMIQQFALIPR